MQSYLQYRRIRALAHESSTSLGQASKSKESWRRASQGNGLQRATSHSHSNDTPTAQTPVKKGTQAPITVTFDGPDDPLNPQNWPLWKKLATNAMTAAVAFIAGFGSSIDAPVIPQAAKEFHVSEETESLATVLFLVGFGAGAPFAGPLSETFGRNPIYLGTLLVFCCWILGSALSPSFGAQLAFRFLAGFFGSTAFTTAGGTLGDVFDHQQRGKIFPWFGAVALFGPMISPVVGGYVGESGLDWRWVEWITLCIASGLFVTMLLFLPETYAPVILGWKAKAMRVATGNTRYKGPLDAVQQTSLVRKIGEALYRPILILLTEPIISVLTAYLTFVYMVSFSFFSGAPYIFTASYDFRQGAAYLMFLGVVVGLWLCALASPFYGMLIGREYQKAAAKGKDHPGPEAMLWWAMIGAPLLPASLFWLAWSDFSSFSFWSPIVACAVFGYSLLSLFLSIYMYIIQAFTKYAASALVAITLVRYVVAGGMVIVSIPMYKNLGVHHAPTVLAGISTAFLPVPYLLYFFGDRIRGVSKRIGTMSQA